MSGFEPKNILTLRSHALILHCYENLPGKILFGLRFFHVDLLIVRVASETGEKIV